jgi:hypothetical protein
MSAEPRQVTMTMDPVQLRRLQVQKWLLYVCTLVSLGMLTTALIRGRLPWMLLVLAIHTVTTSLFGHLDGGIRASERVLRGLDEAYDEKGM